MKKLLSILLILVICGLTCGFTYQPANTAPQTQPTNIWWHGPIFIEDTECVGDSEVPVYFEIPTGYSPEPLYYDYVEEECEGDSDVSVFIMLPPTYPLYLPG